MRNTSLLLAGSLLVIGCSGSEPPGGTTSPLVGTWEGYVEAFAFPSGSDRIQFVIDTHDETTSAVTGRVIFGDGTPPPAATDPDVGYPEGVATDLALSSTRVVEGFAYPLGGATLERLRFRATYDTSVLWSDWCGLQTTTYPGSSSPDTWYGCLPNWGYMHSETACSQPNPDTGEDVPVDCGKLVLCEQMRVCECDAEGCWARPEESGSFDIALDGEVADGTLVATFGDHNVRLERDGG